MNSSSLVALGMASLLLTPISLGSIGTAAPSPESDKPVPPSDDSNESDSCGMDELALDRIPANLLQFESVE